jgi:large subunit ribosomal protein L25
VELDVSALNVGENLALGDLKLPEGVTLQSDPEEIAATVTAPTEISEEEMEAAGIVEEPSEEEAPAEGAAAAGGEPASGTAEEGQAEAPADEGE